jgi:hypothetical protein
MERGQTERDTISKLGYLVHVAIKLCQEFEYPLLPCDLLQKNGNQGRIFPCCDCLPRLLGQTA